MPGELRQVDLSRTDPPGELQGGVIDHVAQRAVTVSFRHGCIVPVGSIRQFRNARGSAPGVRPVATGSSGGAHGLDPPRGRSGAGGSSRRANPRTAPIKRRPGLVPPPAIQAQPAERRQGELQPEGRDPRSPRDADATESSGFGSVHARLPSPRPSQAGPTPTAQVSGESGRSRRSGGLHGGTIPREDHFIPAPIRPVNSPAARSSRNFSQSRPIGVHRAVIVWATA